MEITMTMEDLQMLEVEENEATADFCGYTCSYTCGYTGINIKDKG